MSHLLSVSNQLLELTKSQEFNAKMLEAQQQRIEWFAKYFDVAPPVVKAANSVQPRSGKREAAAPPALKTHSAKVIPFAEYKEARHAWR